MQTEQRTLCISVIWNRKKFIVETDSFSTLLDFGKQLQKLSNVKADTMRLIIPETSSKSSKLLSPFSDEHSFLGLWEISFPEGKCIRMMGVSKVEVDEVLLNAKANLRIAGFDEEEMRLRRLQDKTGALVKPPHGTYIFCDFGTLELPGIELNPPASEALKRMHLLASDPGIVAIMNKHRWRVGIMTEMAPIGYVGVSPKCILGFNKNHGEEISLRLRTDDLKGFRKYESIKQTMLHELAHMMYSEHDAKFYALNKQLNEESVTLDWTKSRSHTLVKTRHFEQENFHESPSNICYRVGGNLSDQPASARAAAVLAAHSRLVNDNSINNLEHAEKHLNEPDPDDDCLSNQNELKHNQKVYEHIECKDYYGYKLREVKFEPESIDVEAVQNGQIAADRVFEELDQPDQSTMAHGNHVQALDEPDPDDSEAEQNNLEHRDDGPIVDPDDRELQRIQESVTHVCHRVEKAIGLLQSEVIPTEICTVIQTLFKIIRNLVDHPEELKFKRLRMANPVFQKNVASYKGARELLSLAGFIEDVVLDEIGKMERYMVLKRDDPVLLWLLKSSLETCHAAH